MQLVRRAFACVLIFAAALAGLAAYPRLSSGGHKHLPQPPDRSHRPAVASRASEFVETVRAALVSGATPFPKPVVRTVRHNHLRGIDVSHYQGRIDWTRVARSGNHFVIAKATEGRTYIDQTYLRNKSQAEANDLAFGAYHFARPDKGPHDAVREANHFLDVARLEPGNVIPVLDLETTGGLSKRQLTRWILTWLRRVRERLGVRPMVYTSPFGWAERTGNTTAVANAGFDALWVAHWGVRRPSLPARDWGGYGWKVWQRSDCGAVPGIRGCVDVNLLADGSLGDLTITVPDTRPPAVRVARSEGFTNPAVVAFDEVIGGISPQNVHLRASRFGRQPSVRLACLTGVGTYVGCASGDVRKVLITPRPPLVPGEHYRVVVNPPTASRRVADRAGNTAPNVVRSFTAPTELEQGSAPIEYSRSRAWEILPSRDGRGRVTASGLTGASAEMRFRGTGVVWRTIVGPNHGLAAIWIDDELVRVVDTYARVRTEGVRHRVSGLSPGIHTVRIEVLGRSDTLATGTVVSIDGFAVIPPAPS
jgi:GH25 family lysozyme M1 (1,4-beta-N-acetylmuramidase)